MNSADKKRPVFSPVLAIFIAILAVSTASLFIRFAQNEVPSLVIAAYRLSLAAIITGIITLPKYFNEIHQLKRNQVFQTFLSGFFLAFHFAAWITSLEFTSVTSSVVLVTTTPIWVALLSPLILKEKINRRMGFYLLIALLGSIVVTFSKSCTFINGSLACTIFSSSKGNNNLLGNVLALLGAFLAAGYVISGRNLRKTINLWPYTLLVYSIASVVLLLLCFLFKYPLFGFSFQSFIWLILLAIVPQIFGHTTLNWVLGFIPAAFVSIALLGEPVGSSILAWLFLKEPPSLIETLGGILILLGIILSSIMMNKVESDHSIRK
jgi:drug/metabolite transporter (DMT)-like permease